MSKLDLSRTLLIIKFREAQQHLFLVQQQLNDQATQLDDCEEEQHAIGNRIVQLQEQLGSRWIYPIALRGIEGSNERKLRGLPLRLRNKLHARNRPREG